MDHDKLTYSKPAPELRRMLTRRNVPSGKFAPLQLEFTIRPDSKGGIVIAWRGLDNRVLRVGYWLKRAITMLLDAELAEAENASEVA